MLSYWSTCSIEIHLCKGLRLMTFPGCHSEKLSGFRVCIFQLILLMKIQFSLDSCDCYIVVSFSFLANHFCYAWIKVLAFTAYSSCRRHSSTSNERWSNTVYVNVVNVNYYFKIFLSLVPILREMWKRIFAKPQKFLLHRENAALQKLYLSRITL